MISAEYDPDDHSVALRAGEDYAGTLYGIHTVSNLIIEPKKNLSGVMFKNPIGLVVMTLECAISEKKGNMLRARNQLEQHI